MRRQQGAGVSHAGHVQVRRLTVACLWSVKRVTGGPTVHCVCLGLGTLLRAGRALLARVPKGTADVAMGFVAQSPIGAISGTRAVSVGSGHLHDLNKCALRDCQTGRAAIRNGSNING